MTKRSKKVLIQLAEYMVAGGAWFWSGYFIIVFTTPHIGLWWANLLGNSVGLLEIVLGSALISYLNEAGCLRAQKIERLLM